jgi:hypothetical protein
VLGHVLEHGARRDLDPRLDPRDRSVAAVDAGGGRRRHAHRRAGADADARAEAIAPQHASRRVEQRHADAAVAREVDRLQELQRQREAPLAEDGAPALVREREIEAALAADAGDRIRRLRR